MEKFYISTAIAYTSGIPHIGNTYEIILADSIARYKRAKGFDVYFQTGTDEHGEKIEKNSKKAGLEPKVFVDDLAAKIKDIYSLLNIDYDKFVRTTDPIHEEKVQKIFKKLYEKGDIYKSFYEGLYCTACESFFTENQLIEGKCPDCGGPVEEKKEEAYFLKMSEYSERLEKFYEENPDFIKPEYRKKEIVNQFIKPGLKDLCVSRTSFDWGIKVDFDENHVVYVWIDALTNYISFLGYDVDGNNSEEYKKYWPCDLHVIGKDILRFHAIYWPVILMALEEELPKKIFAHPWLVVGNEKMGKSKGNTLYAQDLIEKYGVDPVRYYLLSEIPYDSDGSLTEELFINKFNADLANVLGNLVNRTLAMTNKYFDGVIPDYNKEDKIDHELKEFALETVNKFCQFMDEQKVAEASNSLFELFKRTNKYIDETTPWILGKDDSQKKRLATVLYNLIESIRIGGVLLGVFLPDTSEKILNQLNTQQRSFDSLEDFGKYEKEQKTNNFEPLFKRIEEKEIKN